MPRVALKQAIYQQLRDDPTLIGLLGAVSDNNLRIYAGWPQTTPRLTGVEPEEGWLVFYEQRADVFPGGTLESLQYVVDVWMTLLSLAEPIVDVLDTLWHHAYSHKAPFLAAGYDLISSQRLSATEAYQQENNVFRKTLTYQFDVQPVG
jgi:hypothetical protein